MTYLRSFQLLNDDYIHKNTWISTFKIEDINYNKLY